MIVNIARRAHDHNWELDPITRSLLDTDFYKLLMLQFIWKHFPRTKATFALQNRTTHVHLGEIIAIDELHEQLENTRKLRFHKSEMIWLAGNTFYGKQGMFEPEFLEWLQNGFRLSDFELGVEDGQLSLRFEGLWTETTMWEIYALSAIDELKTRAALKRLSEFELASSTPAPRRACGRRWSACAASPASTSATSAPAVATASSGTST